ncbi:MAG TPA: methyltransferase domain-containing protein [Pyrinomonadaceae bacterium]|jgi:SAM-dependent methyltransferase|nr:methyltransferase domain-containing protein [Pyrinomonadaceae bacterium]
MAIYERIGKGYDLTRRADPYIVSRLNHYLKVRANLSYLDVACGTGNYTLALSQSGGTWHGIDQSPRMIGAARKKSDAIFWQLADVTRLPYRERAFSGVVCTLAIHYFIPLSSAFNEIYRVMAAGNFVLFTSTPEQMNGYWLAEYFPEALHQAAEQMPSLEVVNDALSGAGFHSMQTENYSVQEDLQDLFLYSGKHRPAMYMDAAVRAGISTFSLLASTTEIEDGCGKLDSDIKTGRIKDVIRKYEHDEGDYKLIIARKDAT